MMPHASHQTMLLQHQAGLCLLASIAALLHVHVLASQDMLGTQIMVLVRQRPILRQYLLCRQGLHNQRRNLTADRSSHIDQATLHGTAASMPHMTSWSTISAAAHSYTQCTFRGSPKAKSFQLLQQGTSIAGVGTSADRREADLILLLMVHVGLQSGSHGRHMMLRYRQVHHVLVSWAPAAHPQLIKYA